MQVNFPEKAGALRQFLRELMGRAASASGSEARLNVTMFHYRGTGNRSSSALVGLQVPLCHWLTGLVLPAATFRAICAVLRACWRRVC